MERSKRLLLIGASFVAAAAVSVSGIIGFVGLVVPHVMRMWVGPDHRFLLPASMLGGAVLLVNADLLARVLIEPAELPIGIITSLFGCPFFFLTQPAQRSGKLMGAGCVCVVSGLPRSGTSLAMALLQAGGMPVFS